MAAVRKKRGGRVTLFTVCVGKYCLTNSDGALSDLIAVQTVGIVRKAIPLPLRLSRVLYYVTTMERIDSVTVGAALQHLNRKIRPDVRMMNHLVGWVCVLLFGDCFCPSGSEGGRGAAHWFQVHLLGGNLISATLGFPSYPTGEGAGTARR